MTSRDAMVQVMPAIAVVNMAGIKRLSTHTVVWNPCRTVRLAATDFVQVKASELGVMFLVGNGAIGFREFHQIGREALAPDMTAMSGKLARNIFNYRSEAGYFAAQRAADEILDGLQDAWCVSMVVST